MARATKSIPGLPRPGALRWEIAAALSLKIILLLGLWLLIFRWPGTDTPSRPDIAERLSLPSAKTPAPAGNPAANVPSASELNR